MTPNVPIDSHMKRVAIFRSELLPPSETFIRDQVRALRAWEPILIGVRERKGGLSVPGVRREIVSVDNRILDTLRFWSGRANPKMVQRLRELKVNLVHAHFGIGGTEMWPSTKAAGLPLLVTLHGNDITIHREWWEAGHGGLRKRIYPRRLLRMAYEPAVRFVAVSEAIRRRAIEYGIPEKKISTAYIGVDINRFSQRGHSIERRRKRILFVGRMVEKKAPMLMVRVFSQVFKDLPEAELVMIGDGPLIEGSKKLAAELAVPVTFLGARNSDEVVAQMQEARVLCLPSITAANGDAEGFGMVLLEAQACGVPVVTSANGGGDEGVLDGETGYVCAEGDCDALVANLRRILCHDKFASRASASGAKFVRDFFNIESCSAQLELIYDQHSVPRPHKSGTL